MTRNKENRDLEEFKYLIDSRNLTSKEKREEREAILKAREARFRKRSQEEVRIAKLLQLKYQMEDYLNKAKGSSEACFPVFLKTYIDTLYDKRKDFAFDIDIKPMVLSHVLNRHREPGDTFLYRLIIHSQNTFKELCDFEKELWPGIYYKDKVNYFLTANKDWEKSESKHVREKTIKF